MFYVSTVTLSTSIEEISEIYLEISYEDSSSRIIISNWHYQTSTPIQIKYIDNENVVSKGKALVLGT